MENLNGYRAILVHAHPDDETINNGATMALYAKLGAKITLITCTRGEEGEVLIPDLVHLSSQKSDSLGEHRVKELANAMDELGIADHRFLGDASKYRDSGMMGTESNNRKDCFWQASIEIAAAELAKIYDEVKPHVLITYDENGGYGHPDHIQAHRVAMRAAEISKWRISKIYWNAMPKSVLAASLDKMKELGSDFFGAETVDDIPFAKDDALVTSVVDGNSVVELKMAAMRAHGTQIAVDGPFFALSNNLGMEIWGNEYYQLVKGEASGPFNKEGRETNLFAGISL
ncbi:MAG: hypothetical protein RLZ57_929 [Actinomycetota bacterium]|jgi:N-acetyl-1-D-myo-inositol-2-amino-2-deoxy-alpha-D-glucopyranoside deacetylase